MYMNKPLLQVLSDSVFSTRQNLSENSIYSELSHFCIHAIKFISSIFQLRNNNIPQCDIGLCSSNFELPAAILSCAFLKNGDYCYCNEVVLGEKITARHNCYVGLLFDPLD